MPRPSGGARPQQTAENEGGGHVVVTKMLTCGTVTARDAVRVQVPVIKISMGAMQRLAKVQRMYLHLVGTGVCVRARMGSCSPCMFKSCLCSSDGPAGRVYRAHLSSSLVGVALLWSLLTTQRIASMSARIAPDRWAEGISKQERAA